MYVNFCRIIKYFVVLPLYEKVLGFPITAVVGMGSEINPNIVDLNSFIIWSIIPFNFIKGIVVSSVTLALYKSVSPILHKENIERNTKIETDKEIISRKYKKDHSKRGYLFYRYPLINIFVFYRFRFHIITASSLLSS